MEYSDQFSKKICGTPEIELTLLLISIRLVHLKHCIAELKLKVGLIHTNEYLQCAYEAHP